MDSTDRLQRYLRTWNLTIRESRIAGHGNKFEVIHQFPDSRHQRVLGEFMLCDQDLMNMGGYDEEEVKKFIMNKTSEIVSNVTDNSEVQFGKWHLSPSGLI